MSDVFGSLGFVPEDLDDIRPGHPVKRFAFTATNAYRITLELLSAKETEALVKEIEEAKVVQKKPKRLK